jgi:hypothetical protein
MLGGGAAASYQHERHDENRPEPDGVFHATV